MFIQQYFVLFRDSDFPLDHLISKKDVVSFMVNFAECVIFVLECPK